MVDRSTSWSYDITIEVVQEVPMFTANGFSYVSNIHAVVKALGDTSVEDDRRDGVLYIEDDFFHYGYIESGKIHVVEGNVWFDFESIEAYIEHAKAYIRSQKSTSMRITTRFSPSQEHDEDDSTDVLYDGVALCDIQHCQDGTFVVGYEDDASAIVMHPADKSLEAAVQRVVGLIDSGVLPIKKIEEAA
jgi:hypothetical protein